MICDLLFPHVNVNYKSSIIEWFQQGGATIQSACEIITLLVHTFGDKILPIKRLVSWLFTSWDLTPLGSVLWGYMKSIVYADKPGTTCQL